MSETERVLFVHAHPDDESITTGGTLATLVDRGAGVTVVTCTRGERGEVIPDELKYALDSPDTLAALRETELRRALGFLGVTDHRFLGDPDARWAGRPPRRYLDSGMQWGADGAEATAVLDPASLTAAEFGDVAADIAAVILQLRPHVVVSYDANGGYGHPDHIRAQQAAERAAEVYGVPFYAIGSPESTDPTDLSVDVAAVLDRKRAALAAHRTQIVVEGDTFTLSNGVSRPISSVERFRRVALADARELPFAKRRGAFKIFACIVALGIGLSAGALLTVYFQSTTTIGKTAFPIGLVTGLVVIGLLIVGLRVTYATRVVAFWAAVGIVGTIALFSFESPGGSVLIPQGVVPIIWSVAPAVIAVVVLGWPQTHRRAAGRIAGQKEAKGPQRK